MSVLPPRQPGPRCGPTTATEFLRPIPTTDGDTLVDFRPQGVPPEQLSTHAIVMIRDAPRVLPMPAAKSPPKAPFGQERGPQPITLCGPGSSALTFAGETAQSKRAPVDANLPPNAGKTPSAITAAEPMSDPVAPTPMLGACDSDQAKLGESPQTQIEPARNHTEPEPTEQAPARTRREPAPEDGPVPPSTSLPPEHAVEVSGGTIEARPSPGGRGSGGMPAPPAPSIPETTLFREEAVRARFQETAPPALPEIAGTRWAALAMLVTLVTTLVGVAFLGRVEVVSEARGTLRVDGGPRPVAVQSSGVLTSLKIRAGDRVHAGQELASIESKSLRAVVDRAARELDLLREEGKRADKENQARHHETLEALKKKRRLLGRRVVLKRAHARRLRAHARRVRSLSEQKLAVEAEALAAEQAAAAAREELLVLEQQAAEVRIEIADRQHAFASEHINRKLQTRKAENELQEAKTRALLGQVRAPEGGQVESLLVSARQVVQAGQVIAQIVPDQEVTRAVVFAPEKDGAFLRPGLGATLEFPSLPVGEFGRARATVSRVAHDRPLPAEVAAVLGGSSQTEDLIRVELTVTEDAVWNKMAHRLRSGAQLTARLETRKRRIASLLFDFVR